MKYNFNVNSKLRKAVIYASVSSKEQEKDGYSIPAQLKLLYSYAQKHNISIVDEFIDIVRILMKSATHSY